MARNARSLTENLPNCGDLTVINVGINNAIFNRLNERSRINERRRIRHKQTEDTAVVDRVLDQSTRLKLLNLLNSGVLASIGGVIAAGKESNVYRALGSSAMVTPGSGANKSTAALSTTDALAVKVFSISSHGFQHRQKYMQGERRFGKNIAKAHVNKFIKLWAEKEMRNLSRLRRVGVNCPRPVALRDHVLVMTFIGRDSEAAPKLAETQLTAKKYDVLYRKCLLLMRTMFHDCGLVHSDLSEYNLLYDHGNLVVIDLSHGIGSDNANAATFLRDDCINVTRFFARRGARTVSPRAAFEFVIRKLDDDERFVKNADDDVLFQMESALMAEAAAASSDSEISDAASTDLDDSSSQVVM